MVGRGIGRMRDRVSFDRRVRGDSDHMGGTVDSWQEIYTCRAELIYMRGSEAVDAARLQGRSVFKVRIQQSGNALSLDQSVRMRTVNRGLPEGADDQDPLPGARFNVLEADVISGRKWVYLIVETS